MTNPFCPLGVPSCFQVLFFLWVGFRPSVILIWAVLSQTGKICRDWWVCPIGLHPDHQPTTKTPTQNFQRSVAMLGYPSANKLRVQNSFLARLCQCQHWCPIFFCHKQKPKSRKLPSQKQTWMHRSRSPRKEACPPGSCSRSSVSLSQGFSAGFCPLFFAGVSVNASKRLPSQDRSFLCRAPISRKLIEPKRIRGLKQERM